MRASELIKITNFNFSHGDTSLDTQMGHARVRPVDFILYRLNGRNPATGSDLFVIVDLRRARESPLVAATNKN